MSRIRLAILAACLVASAFTARAQTTVTGRLDINGLVSQGQAALTATEWDIGSPSNLFDSSPSSVYRSKSINPAQVTVAFTTPRLLNHFAALAGAATNRFRVESADTMADLDAKTGTYHLMVDWITSPDGVLTTLTPDAPRTARFVRLTTQRMTGDNFVHVYEWEIYSSVTVTSLSVRPTVATVLEGGKQQFTATGQASDGTTSNLTQSVTWTSEDTSVASVDAKGLATGVGVGAADITATLDTLSASGRLNVQADPTDLNVTYIQRTPRYDYNAAKNNPVPGDSVTFTAHVKLWGGQSLTDVAYRWELDGQTVETGTIASFPAFSEQTLSLPWTWQDGNHTVGFVIDPDNAVTEQSELNNSITDRTNAIIAGFWVEQSLYEYFHQKQRNLGVGSNSWEDWIQRQMRKQNELYAQAIWPNSPNGALDRVRIDKIVVVPDGALPLSGGLPTNNPDSSDRTVDLMWGFTAGGVPSDPNNPNEFYERTTLVDENNPFYIEPSLLHELGHARYLIDSYGFDVHNTYKPATGQGYDAVQILENGKPVAGTSLMPFLAFGEVLYYNKSGGVMSGPYGFKWSPYETGALNLIAGRRACCGNANSPGNIGVYLQDLPQNNHVRLVDAKGWPLANADVRLYQATRPEVGFWYGKKFDNTPDLFFTADTDGTVHMPRNPFSSGSITHTYGLANGVAILRIQHPSGLWYRFLEMSDFNMAYWAGHTQDATYTITLPGSAGTPTPAFALRALQIAGGLDALGAEPKAGLDVDGSGQVGVTDAAALLRRSMGL